MHGAPMFVHCCHCTKCQTETGSAFVINALIEADRVETLAGAPEAVMTPTESGRPRGDLALPLMAMLDGAVEQLLGGRAAIRFSAGVGTLDGPGRLTPGIHIYTAVEAALVASARRRDRGGRAYYEPRELWPTEEAGSAEGGGVGVRGGCEERRFNAALRHKSVM